MTTERYPRTALPRYFVTRHTSLAVPERHYWQPSSKLRKLGWPTRRLSNDIGRAIQEAERINRMLDTDRRPPKTPPQTILLPGDKAPAATAYEQYVYAMCNELGHVKIGISKNPEKRRGALQKQSPFRIELLFLRRVFHATPASIEGAIKRALAPYNMRGEWFDIEPAEAVRRAAELTRNMEESAGKSDSNRGGGESRL